MSLKTDSTFRNRAVQIPAAAQINVFDNLSKRLSDYENNQIRKEQLALDRQRQAAQDAQNAELFAMKKDAYDSDIIRQAVQDKQARELFDMKKSEYDRGVAKQDADIAKEAYTNELMTRARGAVTPQQQSAFLKELDKVGGYDAKSVLGAIPQLGESTKAAKVQEMDDLISRGYSKETAADLVYGKKGSSSKDTLKRYDDISKAIGNLGNDNLASLWNRAREYGVEDQFIQEFGVAGGYDAKSPNWYNLTDWGKKDIDTTRLENLVNTAENTSRPVKKTDVKTESGTVNPTPKEVLSNSKEVTRLAKPQNYAQEIQNMAELERRGGLFSVGRTEAGVKAIIDNKYGEGTYDKYVKQK